jgi:hypothetical protein
LVNLDNNEDDYFKLQEEIKTFILFNIKIY